jgi:hypothetical protein
VRRYLAVTAGALGLGAVLRRRRRRRAHELESSPADELREKLAESRAAEVHQATTSAASQDDVSGRRRDVHESARSAIDELS